MAKKGESEMDTKVSVRNHYLDWLRVLAIMFVFVYHSSRFFNQEDWHIKNPVTYDWVEIWNGFAGTWMMPLIFVISGASLFYAIGKDGPGKFIKNKSLRLLVPLLVCITTHASLQVYLERLTHGDFTGAYFQFLPYYYFQGCYEGGNPASGNFSYSGMHLWYLEWLFIFSLLSYPLMRWLKGSGRRVLTGLGSLFALPGAVYLMALPSVLLLAFVDRDSPVMMSEGGWSLLVYLWLLFCGFLLVSHSRLEASIQRLRWISLALALVSISILGYIMISNQGDPAFGDPLYGLNFGLRGFCSWCWILAIFGLAMKPLNFTNAFVKYANEAVLPFYIFHQTVLLCVGYFVVQWPIPDPLRWLAILLISFIVIMLLYEYLVRRFNLLRFLFGMKLRPRRQVTAAKQVQEVAP
jgi:glucan biosynthesis protein C